MSKRLETLKNTKSNFLSNKLLIKQIIWELMSKDKNQLLQHKGIVTPLASRCKYRAMLLQCKCQWTIRILCSSLRNKQIRLQTYARVLMESTLMHWVPYNMQYLSSKVKTQHHMALWMLSLSITKFFSINHSKTRTVKEVRNRQTHTIWLKSFWKTEHLLSHSQMKAHS